MSDNITAEKFSQAFRDKTDAVRASTASAPSPTFDDPPCKTGLREFQLIDNAAVRHLIAGAATKHCELDPAPTWLVKRFAVELSPLITCLFNASMKSGCFPSSQKCAVVTPGLKKPTLDPTDLGNYRPISNLTFLSKVLERAAYEQISNYLGNNNLLPDNQSAYRKHRSTETATLKVMSDVYQAMDAGKITLLSLLDLSAAFDTVDHTFLLQRLHHSFGISDNVLLWLESYLTGRTQYVRFNGDVSSTSVVQCGVPQGSVLGPVLFLLYSAGVIYLIEKHGFSVHGYADDLQVYGHCLQTESAALMTNMSVCIEAIGNWMASNRLRLNPSKTEIIWLGSSRRLGHCYAGGM